ncbi:MAG TPA: hypothetical protein VMT03_23300 [Polyangia bacterium]|nr:hypothetical protein [Polyangia bacterium]
MLVVAACGGGHPVGRDGGAGRGGHDAGLVPDAHAGVDRAADAGAGHDAGCGAGAKQSNGQPCACPTDCASGFCADGVCCNQACGGSCQTCVATGSEGTCVPRANGEPPRTPTGCAVDPASSCGTDGMCDGAGKCRDYPLGTVCRAGTCDGASVSGVQVCDGMGACRPGPTMICAPSSCDPAGATCYEFCASSDECASGYACDAKGSCGRRRGGAACKVNDDCLSGYCADGVCCNSACDGACVACNLPARAGICWPIDTGVPDPHRVCKDQGIPSCGQTGLCDGLGGCALYAFGTACTTPSCTGNLLNTAGTCDGLGSCRPPGLLSCAPFQCQSGACTSFCDVDADCDTGIGCVNHTCGPKQDGQLCKSADECKSNQCVDGVCCDSACTGACRSCALPGSIGKCTMAPVGSGDPRATCKDAGAAGCSTNGKCDGAGSCQLYTRGTTCAPESCSSNVYTPMSTCDGAGHCATPDALPCSPYTCNGSTCFNACTVDTQCVTPNRCTASSCGPANNGATCATNAACKSNICAQGYCCDKACGGPCQSCALTGTLGICTNVPTGSADPSGMCKDQGATGCGTNGKCQAGACQKYASGTACGAATCPTGTVTFTGTQTCDGAGTCIKPASSSCFPYMCGSAACKGACTANADCDPPAVCTSGSCGLKDPGRTCASGAECKSGFCNQTVCCSTNCTGACRSCNVSATTAGTCTSVPAGQSDPQGTCKDQGAGTCGTNGVCDGAGACQKYAAGTVCVASSCPTGMSVQTNARTCDGKGTCQVATTTNCNPFACSGTTSCNTACKADTDCLSPNICDPKTSLCGNKKRQGQTCSAAADCLTGLSCVDGVCCASTACGTCQACNVTGSAGTCANVPSGGAEPHGKCPTSSTAPCGNTGACTGSGTCQQAAATVACGTAGCTGSTYTPVSHCDGAGACAAAATKSCTPFVCGTGACKTSCTADTDCLAPFTCQGTTTKSCSLKANGLACTMGAQCISGNCVDGTCCGSASCPACQACNVNGQGTCAGVASGTADTRCGGGTTTCGKVNVCDGAGACQTSTAMCGAAACSGSLFTPASFCSGTGTTCPMPTQVNCGNYACTTSGCNNSCTGTSTGCASGSYCDATGHCQSTVGLGALCTADAQCSAGRCVDGVCCNTTAAACPACQACNVSGHAGSCSPVPAGAMCGAPSCSAGMQVSARVCDGAGNCPPATTTPCDPFVCGPTACKLTCASAADCISGDYCDAAGSCQTEKAPGTACGSTSECATGVCGAEGVCCDTTCDGLCMSCKLAASPGICSTVSGCAADGGSGN